MADTDALKATVEYCVKIYKPSGKSDPHRWYPSQEERASCCESIREPSRAYPWSFYKHCCSKKHVRQCILEHPTVEQARAIVMTMETAPLFFNETGLLLYVAKKLTGGE